MALSVAQCGGSCRSSIPSSSHLLCTSSQHCGGHGCVSSLPLLARLRPDVERLLLLKNADRLVQQQLPVSASRMMKQASPRFRLSAVAELQSIGRGGGGVVAEEFEKAFDVPAQQLEDSSSFSPTGIVVTSPEGTTVVGPEVGLPGPAATNPVPDAAVELNSSIKAAVESAAPPSIPDSATQSGADALKAAGEADVSAQSSITDSLSSDQFNDVQDTISGAGKAAENLLEETKTSVTDTITASQDAVARTLTNIQDSVQDAIGAVGNAVKDVYDGFNGNIKSTMNSVTGFYEQTVGDIQTTVDRTVTKAEGSVVDFTSPFQIGTPVNNALKEVVNTVNTAVGSALEASGKVVAQFYGSTKVLLPVEAQSAVTTVEQKIDELSKPVGDVLQQVLVGITNLERAAGVNPENPIIPVLLVVGGTLYIGVSYWQARYGGYSGDLKPTSALDLLKKDGNVVLVDIRPQVERENQGVPDLRRGARSRSAIVEIFKVEGSLRSKLRNPKETDTIITAAIIRNLKNVKPNTKVIVMDENGSQSKNMARALRRFGIKKRYRVDGGFQAWSAAGLRTKVEGIDSPITILKEDTEELVDEVKPTPDGIFLACVGIVAGLYVAIEWEKTLQLIGVIGIGQAVYSRVKAYDSVEALKADLRLLQTPFSLATQGILWIAGQVEPAKLQLATAPSTSAVQERVVQAAAKHGPLASEDEPESDVELEPESEQEPEGESAPYLSTEEPNAMRASPEESSPPSQLE